MKVLFDITHPAHVHLFRNTIDTLRSQDCEVRVTSREKDITTYLLDAFDIPHTTLSSANGSGSLAKEWLLREMRLFSVAKSFQPDIIMSRFNPAAAHISTILGFPYIMFEDTGKKKGLMTNTTYYLSDIICTPAAFPYNLGEDQVRYEGFQELAYLHPNWFTPDKAIIENFGISSNETYSLLRFVGWNAHHDNDEEGLSLSTKRKLVSRLAEYGSVYITSEDKLPSDLAKYQLPVPPEHVHQLLYHANLFVGDSQTMTCEAGVLGTPAIRSNSLATADNNHATSNLSELEEEYGLVFSTANEERALELAEDIIADNDGRHWQEKRTSMIEEKTDVTATILDMISNTTSSRT